MPQTTNILHESRTKLPEYAEACYVAENIDWYANLKGGEIPQKYKHLALTDPDTHDSTTILNGLRGHGAAGQDFFQDVPKSIAGDLQPYIKIYKVIPDSTTKSKDNEILIPLKFNNLRNLDRMTSNKLGVAFRSFTFDFEGTRPVEVDTYLRCSLKLYFESPKALFKEYITRKHTYSFADLIRRSVISKKRRSPNPDKTHRLYDETVYRIRVDVGYNLPATSRLIEAYRSAGFSKPKDKASSLRAALAANKMQLYLNLLKHSITPVYDAPDGGFELSIDYVGSIETSFKSKAADILYAPTDKAAAARERELKADAIARRDKAYEGLTEEEQGKVTAFVDAKGDFGAMVRQEQVKSAKTAETKSTAAKVLDETVEYYAPGSETEKMEEKIAEGGNKPVRMKIDPKAKTEAAAAKKVIKNEFGVSGDKEMGRVRTYLDHVDFKNNNEVGQVIYKAKKLSRMYSQILDRLSEKKQLHFIQVPESDLYSWFAAKKARVKAESEEDELEEVNKEIATLKKKDPKDEKDAEQLRVLNQKKTVLEDNAKAAKTGTGAAKGAVAKPVQNGASDSPAVADSNKATDDAAADQARAASRTEAEKEQDAGPDSRIPHTEMAGAAPLAWRNIYFFYYGDLLDTVLERLYQFKGQMDLDWWSASDTEGVVKFLLGDVEFQHPQKRIAVKENLARIPITLKVWQEFWIENVIDQWRTEYLFDSFLNDSLSQLVLEALTGRCKEEGNINVNVLGYPSYLTINSIANRVIFSKPKGKAKKDNAYYYSHGAKSSPKKTKAKSDASKAKSGELIFVQGSSNSGKWYTKNKTVDNQRGVYHIELGRENSTIINFTMNRSNQPHYLEAKLESAGIDDTEHFGEPYNYDITMFGNALLIPGKHVNISFPVTWWSAEQQKGLGVGGYCMVLKTKNEVKSMEARLEWTTNMQCLWQSFGGNKKPVSNSGHGSKPIVVPSSKVFDRYAPERSFKDLPGTNTGHRIPKGMRALQHEAQLKMFCKDNPNDEQCKQPEQKIKPVGTEQTGEKIKVKDRSDTHEKNTAKVKDKVAVKKTSAPTETVEEHNARVGHIKIKPKKKKK